MLLSRQRILTADDLDKALVSCPEWGGDLYVRVMTAYEREVYERRIDNRQSTEEPVSPDTLPPSLRIGLVILTACDMEGQPLFLQEDETPLLQKSQVVTTRIFEASWELNRLGADQQQAVKKNSAIDPIGASSSALL